MVNGTEISGAAGATVDVTKNYVTVHLASGEDISYLRYETELFRKYYQTLLYGSLEGAYSLSTEEEKALINDPSKLLLALEVDIKLPESYDGITEREQTYIYKFYELSLEYAYITINGQGGYYVARGCVEKLIENSQKFFMGQNFDPAGN